MRKKIQVATPTRGFLNHLFKYDEQKLNFINSIEEYEIVSKKKIILHKLAKLKLFDRLGFIHKINTGILSDEIDYAFSYNKFLRTNKPYIIYLENPFALMNYSINRPYSKQGKKNLLNAFNDPNLKGIICASKSCEQTLKKIYNIPERIYIDQIYPLIPNSDFDFTKVSQAKYSKVINCLFISSRFQIKGGLEVLELFNLLDENSINDIHLTIITDLDSLDSRVKSKIDRINNIQLYDFDFSSKELNEIYLQNDILLNPTRMDSFSLVTLEAMKYGNVIISSDLYALVEMAEDGFNGYLVSPKYRFYKKNNMPNPSVWNNRDETIASNYIDKNLIEIMYDKLMFLRENNDTMRTMQKNSYDKANSGEFNSEYIFKKWKSMFNL